MPRDVATKCTFPHASHMTPMWIGMPADYGTINPGRVSGQLSTIGEVVLAALAIVARKRFAEAWYVLRTGKAARA
jgi:hypothetical protein